VQESTVQEIAGKEMEGWLVSWFVCIWIIDIFAPFDDIE